MAEVSPGGVSEPGGRALIPNPALAPLGFLVGEWRTAGTHPLVPGETLNGRTSFAWHEGGAFVIMRSQVDHPQFPDGVAIIGSDGASGKLTMVYFDEREVSRILDVTAANGSVTWRHEDPEFTQSLTIASEGDTLVSKGRMSKKGGVWEDDLSQVFTREAPLEHASGAERGGGVSGSAGAAERRREQDPDILIGPLAMWVGTGEGQSWPWIDVAVRIGEGWERVVDLHGPMLQRPDLLALAPAIREFAERKRDDVALASIGGSMRLLLRRSEYGSLRAEASFDRGRISQTAAFALWDGALWRAVEGAERMAKRLEESQWGWRPSGEPGSDSRLPRESGVDEDAKEDDRPPAGPWDSGLGPGEDVEFDFEFDGYGWYGIAVRTGTAEGGFGGGYLTDPMGDLLRAGLALLAGAPRAELTCNAEPVLTRVEFERVLLALEDPAPRDSRARYGCRIRIREVDEAGGEPKGPDFDALCRSPRAVAEALYRMALPHFRHGAGPWSDAMAALEAALAAVPDRQS